MQNFFEDIVPLDRSLVDAERVHTPVAQAPRRQASDVVIMSFNVPCNTGDNRTGSEEWRRNLFKHRAPFVASLFDTYGVDVAALQEPHERHTRALASLLEPGAWEFLGCGREADGSSEYQPIFFRTARRPMHVRTGLCCPCTTHRWKATVPGGRHTVGDAR